MLTVITRVSAFHTTAKVNPPRLKRTWRPKRRAHTSRRAHRILAHAIEYVANQFLQDSIPPGPRNSRLQAVQLLMALDLRVYSESEVTPAFAQRFFWFLRLPRKSAAIRIR